MQNQNITETEYTHIQRLLYRVAGIKLGEAKKEMVCGRLSRRLREHGLTTYTEYLRLLADASHPEELQVAIDLLTTNETYFFREPGHFAFLSEQILPNLGPRPRGQPFRVWSAACSSGEEVYSIAMLLSNKLGDTSWEVVGSDLSTRVLERARSGQYPMERAKDIPRAYLTRYCLKGVRSQEDTFIIDPKLRKRTRFLQVNLNEELPDLGQMDLIFLRNVLIYFDNETKKQVVARLSARLCPGGYFIIGHSETLNGIAGDLVLRAPTLYQKSSGTGGT